MMTSPTPCFSGRIAGVDYGTVRIGIAIPTPMAVRQPVGKLQPPRTRSRTRPFPAGRGRGRIGAICDVGCRCTSTAGKAKSIEAPQFGQWLAEMTGVAVEFYDERFTSQRSGAASAAGAK